MLLAKILLVKRKRPLSLSTFNYLFILTKPIITILITKIIVKQAIRSSTRISLIIIKDLFNSKDKSSTKSATKEQISNYNNLDSKYSNNKDKFITNNKIKSYLIKADKVSDPVTRSMDIIVPAEFKEEV